jgi:hypothetical protein
VVVVVADELVERSAKEQSRVVVVVAAVCSGRGRDSYSSSDSGVHVYNPLTPGPNPTNRSR